ncbi:hypothetical protein LR48_Vigan01g122300 [Vigna angularis]|uniref:Cation-transporting P-type ATPase C-terminal domain-containing protein n=1 Tax=Phaseolus angularis TaxID=3914 RepID=A0A0L9TM44_PHAAN|nr:hypothetical protein LR48_Vigan01g122300 [Vigna angularis]
MMLSVLFVQGLVLNAFLSALFAQDLALSIPKRPVDTFFQVYASVIFITEGITSLIVKFQKRKHSKHIFGLSSSSSSARERELLLPILPKQFVASPPLPPPLVIIVASTIGHRLLRFIVIGVFAFILLVLFLVFLIWVILRTTKLRFTLQDVTLFTFNLSSPIPNTLSLSPCRSPYPPTTLTPASVSTNMHSTSTPPTIASRFPSPPSSSTPTRATSLSIAF